LILLAIGVVAFWQMRYRFAPISAPPLARTITIGDAHMLAIDKAGRIFGWGRNVGGALGLPEVCVADRPTLLITEPAWRSVHTGTEASYAIARDGSLWRRAFSQRGCALSRGLGSQYEALNWDSRWVKVQQAWNVAAGLDEQGVLWFWNDREVLPEAARDLGGRAEVALVKATGAQQWRDFCLSVGNSYAIATDGALWTDTLKLKPSDGHVPRPNELAHMAHIPTSSAFTRVFCSDVSPHVLALDMDGHLWGFGDNSAGALGNGAGGAFPKIDTIAPEAIQRLNSRRWKDIAVGSHFTIGITDDGSLWSWGNNAKATLGTGDRENSNRPRRIDHTREWVSVSAGGSLAAGLTREGILYTWGSADDGALGQGRSRTSLTPTRISGEERWAVTALSDMIGRP